MAALQQRVEFANTLRGLAAVMVLLAHYGQFFWDARTIVGYLINAPELPSSFPVPFPLSLLTNWLNIIYPWINFGSLGVGLFFLVSGFVIPFSFKHATGAAFLIGRAFRILPVYAAGFSLTLVAIWFCGLYFQRPWPFATNDVLVHYIPGLRDVLGTRGIDGIVWTLEIEMKFYIVCAVAAQLFRRNSVLILALPILLSAAALALWYIAPSLDGAAATAALALPRVFAYIDFMFCGVLFYCLFVGNIRWQTCLIGIIGFFGAYYGLLRLVAKSEAAPFLSYAAAILIFATSYRLRAWFKKGRVADFLSGISYPLYVVHSIAGYVVIRVLTDLGVPMLVSVVVALGFVFAIAWAIHIIIEGPFHALGKKMGRLISRPIRASEPVPLPVA